MMRKIVIAGGSGFLGSLLASHYSGLGDQVVILSRGKARQHGNINFVNWDGKHAGEWSRFLNGCDVLVNLNGKSVDCRYNEHNKGLIYATRLDATNILGEVIQQCKQPPKVWINSASGTIYRHSLDKDMDEYTGEIGTGFSVDVCQKWEAAFNSIDTPGTRKVIIRTAIVLGKHGGALQPLKMLARLGLGGKQGPGDQYFSWLHEKDFVSIIEFIINHEELQGVYNLAAPTPIPNHHIMETLCHAVGMPIRIPMPAWLLEFGAVLINTETELILKSRRVVPKKILDAGYRFHFDKIETALADLCQ